MSNRTGSADESSSGRPEAADALADRAASRKLGKVEAELANQRLLIVESQARERMWLERALEAEKAVQAARYEEQQAGLWRALHLEEELENARAEREVAKASALAAEAAATAARTEGLQLAERYAHLEAELEKARAEVQKTRGDAEKAGVKRDVDVERRKLEAERRAGQLQSELERSRTDREVERVNAVEARRLIGQMRSEMQATLDERELAQERARRAERTVGELRAALARVEEEGRESSVSATHETEQLRADLRAAVNSGVRAREAVERSVAFQRSVEGSAGWRLLQTLRALIGRKW